MFTVPDDDGNDELEPIRGLRFQEFMSTELTEQLVGCDSLEVSTEQYKLT